MKPMLKSQKTCFLSEGHSMLTASCKTIFGLADFLRKTAFCLDFYKPVPAELQISVTHSIKKWKRFFYCCFDHIMFPNGKFSVLWNHMLIAYLITSFMQWRWEWEKKKKTGDITVNMSFIPSLVALSNV